MVLIVPDPGKTQPVRGRALEGETEMKISTVCCEADLFVEAVPVRCSQHTHHNIWLRRSKTGWMLWRRGCPPGEGWERSFPTYQEARDYCSPVEMPEPEEEFDTLLSFSYRASVLRAHLSAQDSRAQYLQPGQVLTLERLERLELFEAAPRGEGNPPT